MNESGITKQKHNDVQLIIMRIKDVLQAYSGIAAVYLLGSAQNGNLRADSDIDIAILPEAGVAILMQSRLEMAALLEEKLGRTVDIGIITSRNLIYASEAILKGQRIIMLNDDYTNMSETSLLGCYYVFRQDRKEVEESYYAA